MKNPLQQPALPGLEANVSLAALNTLQVGGTGRWLISIADAEEFRNVLAWAKRHSLPVLYIGEGSNVLFSDLGYAGLIIRNEIRGREHAGKEVQIGAGENLCEVIRWLNQLGLAGLERMNGIPGTIGGAVVGNAGAYGQEIGDTLIEADLWSGNGQQTVPSSQLDFRYRHSILKEKRDWFLLNCRFKLQKTAENLQEISDEILAKRLPKYPWGLKCPGSFFKNVLLDELSPEALERIPDDFIMFGKVPAGKLLEAVGAKGVRRGAARFADYHANLIVNLGGASSRDILSLADEYAGKVWEQFRVRLDPEILIVDDDLWPNLQGRDE